MASSKPKSPTAKPKNPTEKQCDSWKFSLENALQDLDGFKHFYAFLEQYETERKQQQGVYTRYLDFWTDCNNYKQFKEDIEDLKQKALKIVALYLAPRAKKRIELGGDDDIITKLKETIGKVETDDESGISVLTGVFDEALDSMREYLDEGGCCKAYDRWKKQLI
ncbi:unnamed protein product, partial [Meganyctiphanes norvegica]